MRQSMVSSEKAATDYATEQRDKFRTSYESDNYGIEILSSTSNAAYRETCVEVTVTYHGSDALAACEEYKIGEVRVSV